MLIKRHMQLIYAAGFFENLHYFFDVFFAIGASKMPRVSDLRLLICCEFATLIPANAPVSP